MRLLIADDEDYTREGLLESIKWSDYGINEIKQARDGREALEISLSFKPDIILTDVRMPKLNGIEFAEELIKQCPESKVLFMSAYMEIDYLKSAIKLSAIDYIEKPINLTFMENAVKKAVEFINEKRKLSVSSVEMKELQMQRLANMLRFKNKDIDIICRISEEVGFPVQSNYISLVIWNKERLHSEEKNTRLINAFWSENNIKCISCNIEDDKYFVIIKLMEKEIKKVYSLCEKFAKNEKTYCIGIGHEVKDLMNVCESYETAILNVELSFYDTKKSVFITEDKIAYCKSIPPTLYTEFNSVMKDTPKKLLDWTEQLLDKFCLSACYKKEQLQALFFTFAKLLLQDKKNVITRLENIYNEEDVERSIMQTNSIFKLKDFMLNLVQEYQREVEEGFKYSKIVRDVIDYIDAHYTDVELGIEDIAKYMHFSSAHLSVLFKQETGITIKQYISDYRMELSKKLLANEHYKINEISELCGYSNANYFAKVFKAATDLSPVEYRKKCGII